MPTINGSYVSWYNLLENSANINILIHGSCSFLTLDYPVQCGGDYVLFRCDSSLVSNADLWTSKQPFCENISGEYYLISFEFCITFINSIKVGLTLSQDLQIITANVPPILTLVLKTENRSHYLQELSWLSLISGMHKWSCLRDQTPAGT